MNGMSDVYVGVCVWVSLCSSGCVPCMCKTYEGQRRALDLELQAVVTYCVVPRAQYLCPCKSSEYC